MKRYLKDSVSFMKVEQDILDGKKTTLEAGIEVLVDDRNERPGVMFADAELIGIPHRIVISEKGLHNNTVEYKARTEDGIQIISLEKILDMIVDITNQN